MAEQDPTTKEREICGEIGDLEDILKELAALGLAVDALGFWISHSGSVPSGEEINTLGIMIQKRVMEAQEIFCSRIKKEGGV